MRALSAEIENLEIKIDADAASASKGIDQLVASLNKLKSIKESVSGIKEVSAALGELAGQVARLRSSEFAEVAKGVDALSNALKNLTKTSRLNMDSTTQKLHQLSEMARKLSDLDNTSGAGDAGIGVSSLADSLARAKEAAPNAQQLASALHRLSGVQVENVRDLTKSLRDLVRLLDGMSDKALEAMTALSRLSGIKLSGLKDALKGDIGVDSAELERATKNLRNNVVPFRRPAASPSAAPSAPTPAAASQPVGDIFAGATAGATRLNETVAQLRATISSALDSKPVLALGSALNGLGGITEKVVYGISRIPGLLKKLPVNGIKKVATAFGSLAKNAVKLMGQLTGLNKAFSKLGNHSNNFHHGLLKTTAGIAVYTAIYTVLMKVSDAFKTGLDNIAAYSNGANQALSSIKTSAVYLSNSLGAVAAPLLSVLAPAIERIVNIFVDAINVVGQFFALLSGSGTYTRAVRVAQSYGTATSGAAGSTKDLADATKDAAEASRTLLGGLDEINQLNSNKTTSGTSGGGGGGGGGSGGGSGVAFETVPVNNAVSDLYNTLKGFIDSGDWEGLGYYLADHINAGLAVVSDALSWDNVGPKITKFIDAFTDLFNALVERIDWGLLGKTVGEAINDVVYTLTYLNAKIDWQGIGTAFAKGFNGLVDTVDGEYLGRALMIKLNAITRALSGFVESFDFAGLGNLLASGLNGMFHGVDWDVLGASLGTGISGALTTLRTAINAFDWKGNAAALASGLNNLVKNTDFKNLGATLGDALIGALNGLRTFISQVNWSALARAIEDALSGVNWGGVMTALSGAIGSALGGLDDFVRTLLGDAFNAIASYFGERIEGAGGDIVGGLFVGIVDALTGVGAWILSNVFAPFIDGFCNSFGIHSPSTVMAEKGEYLIEGVFEGILNAISGVGSWIKTNVVDPILSGFGGIAEIPVTVVKTITAVKDAAWSKVTSAWDAVKNSEVVKTVSGAISGAWDKAKSAWDSVKDSKPVKTIAGAVGGTWNNLKNTWNAIKDTSTKKTITGKIANTFTSTKNTYNALKDRSVTATTKGSQQGTFTSVKKTFDAFKNKSVTATTAGSQLQSFKNARSNYNDLKNKSVTASLKSSGKTFGLKITYTNPGGWRSAVAKVLGLQGWPTIRLARKGGFPDIGSLFVAGEAGPEMVGNFNGKTGVANSEQIVTGIYNATYSAMMAAMRGGMGGSGDITLNATLMLDGKVVGKQAIKYHNDVKRTTGSSPLLF